MWLQNNPHLHFLFFLNHSLVSSLQKGSPWRLKASLLWVNLSYITISNLFKWKCQCTILNKSIIRKRVPVQYVTHQCQWGLGHFFSFPTEKISTFSPIPLTGHSSAGQRDYWGSSISYVLSYNDYGSIMQFLKTESKEMEAWNWREKVPKWTEKQTWMHERIK